MSKQSPSKKLKNKHKTRLPVDLSRINMGNSYDSPPEFYSDRDYVCVDCGNQEIWSAEQQKWWYETVQALIYTAEIRCRDCRAKKRAWLHQEHLKSGHKKV